MQWWNKPGWIGDAIALLCGSLITLSLAPFNFWPLGIIAAAALALLLDELNGRQGLRRSVCFGLGAYGSGASWVFVAIHVFGNTPAPLAIVMTAIFVAGLAFVFAIPFYLYSRFLSETTAGKTLGFAIIWVLGEWTRSWFLTGFPWLFVGYGHVDTWLSGWAPITGIFGISLCVALTAALMANILRILLNPKDANSVLRTLMVSAPVICILWLGGLALSSLSWYDSDDTETLSVAVIQPNIPLEVKWNPVYQTDIMDILREQTQQHWDKDLIVWPEAAVPLLYHDAQLFLEEMSVTAQENNTGIITGILYDDVEPGIFYNSIIGLGNAEGTYFKQRLVPFGEYVPLQSWLRGLIAFFDMQNSVMNVGPANQEILALGSHKLAPSICYEIVYPDLVAELAREAGLIITISNDAWFGDSIGPKQHFEMAQMRALENQKYVVRSTNTGISGIISPKGEVVSLADATQRDSIDISMTLNNAKTPFSQWQSTPIITLCVIVMVGLFARRIKKRQKLVVSLPD